MRKVKVESFVVTKRSPHDAKQAQKRSIDLERGVFMDVAEALSGKARTKRTEKGGIRRRDGRAASRERKRVFSAIKAFIWPLYGSLIDLST